MFDLLTLLSDIQIEILLYYADLIVFIRVEHVFWWSGILKYRNVVYPSDQEKVLPVMDMHSMQLLTEMSFCI